MLKHFTEKELLLAWPLGVLSATIPDAVAVSVNGTGGFIGGGTVGVQSVGYVQQGSGASYSFAGATAGPPGNQVGFLTPQVAAGFTISVAWSSEYNPNPSSWTGKFSEANVGEGVVGVNAFQSDTWFGVGVGGSVGPVPLTASYFDNVDYQFLTPQANNNAPPQWTSLIPTQSPNNTSIGK